MTANVRSYRAIVSSDWNECLAPTGPFDPISFHHPELKGELSTVFRLYTGNRISLTEAARQIQGMVPDSLTEEQMDGYLDAAFKTYKGVPEFIAWCLGQDILFMINTTGTQGFFQRVIAKGLLPPVPVISAHPVVRYPKRASEAHRLYDLFEIQDKATNTERAMRSFHIPPEKAILIGDSGGDGPHFEWGRRVGAYLVGSMTKWSLEKYCTERDVEINLHFGLRYGQGEERDPDRERGVDFTELKAVIRSVLSGCRKGL